MKMVAITMIAMWIGVDFGGTSICRQRGGHAGSTAASVSERSLIGSLFCGVIFNRLRRIIHAATTAVIAPAAINCAVMWMWSYSALAISGPNARARLLRP